MYESATQPSRGRGGGASSSTRCAFVPLNPNELTPASLRTAAVINVGTATLAAFIGAGGLGEPIVTGLALSDTALILSGAIPAALLALLVDVALGVCERAIRPRGLA